MRRLSITRFILSVLIAVVLIAGWPTQAMSLAVILEDDNSTIEIDMTFDTASRWRVDSVQQELFQGWFFRIGNGNEFFAAQPDLILVDSKVTDTRGATSNDGVDNVWMKFSHPDQIFDFEISYSLDGGLSGSLEADLAEQVSIINKTDTVLDFHAFQFNDFMLGGTQGGDTAYLVNSNTIRQEGDWGSLPAPYMSEVVATPPADKWEINNDNSLWTSLIDNLPTDLANTGNGLTGGNVVWAWQWDFSIDPYSSVSISKDKHLFLPPTPVPEPSTLLLLGTGLIGLAGFRRKFRV